MPPHFQLICNEDPLDLFTAITKDELAYTDGVAVSSDKKYALFTRKLNDVEEDVEALRCVYTMRQSEGKFELIDVDLVIPHENAVKLRFNELLPDSSDADEYYSAQVGDENIGLEVETVNRHLVEGKLEGKECEVHLCAFPTSLRVFDDIDALNVENGWGSVVTVVEKKIAIDGVSETFMAPGGIVSQKKERGEDDYHTIMVGKVVDYKVHSVEIGEYTLEFGVAYIESAAGKMPVIINLEHEPSSNIAVGKVLMMTALIKANFAVGEGGYRML